MKFQRGKSRRAAGIEMTSLMDFVFLLLCFFVTASSFSEWETETAIPLTLPEATSAEMPNRRPGEIVLNVEETGMVSINGRILGEAELRDSLMRLSQFYPGQRIVIRADKETSYENLVKTIDACRNANIWNFSLATRESTAN